MIRKFLYKFFSLTESGTNLKTEIIAGCSTFAAMSYVLAVNPAILAEAGMDKATLVTVTALAAAIGCFLMGFFAKLPVALAPTMGTNTYFAVVICVGMGLNWREALALVFYNGIFFLLISITGIRKKLIMGVPRALQIGLQTGIGMFIAFLGLQSSKLVIDNPATLVMGGILSSPECLYAIFGIALLSVLICRKNNAAVIISIAALTVLGFFVTDSNGGRIATVPTGVFSMPHGISETFMQLDFLYPFREPAKAIPVVFILLMLDLLDTMATVIAMARAGGMLRKDGTFKNMGRALTADATATIAGAVLGTSTTGAYVESSAGIEAGGKTGLTAIVTGILFILALFLSPLIECVPAAATAPALIIIGILMMRAFKDVDFSDVAVVIPVFICMIMIAFTFKISEGFAFGLIAYVFLFCITGRAKKITVETWFLFAMMCAFICSI